MDKLVVQDVIRIDSATANNTQDANGWAGVAGVVNIVFWVVFSELNLSGGTLKIFLETAPEREDPLFQPMVSGGTSVTQAGVQIVKVLIGQNPDVPVGRWIRWRLEVTGANAPWNVTFRVLACCSTSGDR